jgi:hypothetical protein
MVVGSLITKDFRVKKVLAVKERRVAGKEKL